MTATGPPALRAMSKATVPQLQRAPELSAPELLELLAEAVDDEDIGVVVVDVRYLPLPSAAATRLTAASPVVVAPPVDVASQGAAPSSDGASLRIAPLPVAGTHPAAAEADSGSVQGRFIKGSINIPAHTFRHSIRTLSLLCGDRSVVFVDDPSTRTLSEVSAESSGNDTENDEDNNNEDDSRDGAGVESCSGSGSGGSGGGGGGGSGSGGEGQWTDAQLCAAVYQQYLDAHPDFGGQAASLTGGVGAWVAADTTGDFTIALA